MVKKEAADTLFYVSIGLIVLSTVFLTASLAACITLLRKRRKRYCANCRQIIKIENVILKKGLHAVSHNSLVRVKKAISDSLTENPEYDPIPDYRRDRVLRASNPQYAPIDDIDYTTMHCSSEGSMWERHHTFGELKGAKSKDSVIRVYNTQGDLMKSSRYLGTRQEYEYMRSPRLSKKPTYVNMKTSQSTRSITSTKSAVT